MTTDTTTTTTTMRAVLQDGYGDDPATLLRTATVPRPEPGPDQVLVQVAAAAVDRGTVHLLTGRPWIARPAIGMRRPRQPFPGRDVAGTVVEVGAAVTGLAVGDEVYGTVEGSLAEFVVGEVDRLAPRPTNLAATEAAAVPISGLTAIQAVRDHGRVGAGDRVLVIGASGGVGSYAVQVAKALGAEVTGVCRTAAVDFVKGLGADHVVDHTVEEVLDGDARYDVVIDTGGHRRVRALRRILTREGRLVIVGSETGGRLVGGVQRLLWAALLSPFVPQRLGGFISSENAADLRALTELIEADQVRPAVAQVLPFEQAAEAIARLAAGGVRGKLAIEL